MMTIANVKTPVILEEQQKVVNWARKLRKSHIKFPTIIEYLVSDKVTRSRTINDGLNEARKIYNKYNLSWRNQLLTALMIDNYRFENDITEGSIVTNGKYIGYAFYIDYQRREFILYSSNHIGGKYLVGRFQMDDFERVVLEREED